MPTLKLPSGVLEYDLQFKAVKNINLRVRADGSVAVSAPKRAGRAGVERFLREREDFLLRARQRLSALPAYLQPPETYHAGGLFYLGGEPLPVQLTPEGGGRVGDSVLLPDPEGRGEIPYRSKAVEAVKREWLQALDPCLWEVAARFAGAYGVAPSAVVWRDAKSRWGSCKPDTRRIMLSTRLAHLPPAAAEYVIVHEFAHLVQPNHSPAFYRVVEEVLPDYRSRLALLK